MYYIIYILLLAQVITALPLPAIITRYHTAPAVTTIETHTTGTTTLYLPPVHLLISNGVSYLSTMTNEPWATTPVTITSVVNKQAQAPTPAPEQLTKPTEAAKPDEPAETVKTPATQVTPVSVATSSIVQGAAATSQVVSDNAPATSATPATPATSSAVNTPVTTKTPAATTSTISSPATSSITPSSGSGSGSGSSSGSISPPSTIVYSPYADDGSCKEISTINSDLDFIFSKGMKNLRIYGTDCHNFDGILPKANALGMKVNQGVWFTPQGGPDSIDGSISDIIEYGKSNGWGIFDFITIGNEAINDKYLSVDQLISKITSVKSQLKSSGFNGPVATSEPPVSFTKHPELCDAVDIVGINPHSYFDASVGASSAGSFVMGQKQLVQDACGSSKILITETGYPSKGNTNGKNVPSSENQDIAIKSILDHTGGDVTILTTYNDFWKHPGPYGIEQWFGTINLFN